MDLLTPINNHAVNNYELLGAKEPLFSSVSDIFNSEKHTEINLSSWGLSEFDRVYGGICAGSLNLLSTPNYDSAIAATGHFLTKGLRSEQRVALVSLENPNNTFSKLAAYGFHYDAALRSERLVYLYFKPTFHNALSCTTDYRLLFDELISLSGPVSRVAILNAELLFNLQSENLARESAAKLAAVTSFDNPTIMGSFVKQNSRSHAILESVCSSMLPSYIVIKAKPSRQSRHYVIDWRKGPHVHQKTTCKVELLEGKGYVTDSIVQSQIA